MTGHALPRFAGGWALVTGASSGIGAAFATALARAHLNLVLVARRAEPLHCTAASCRQAGVQVVELTIDLACTSAARAVHQAVGERNLHLDLLINNAGADPWGGFESQEPETHERLLLLLAATPMGLCRMFHADLAATHGVVINVSSPAAFQPMPWKAAYAAGKAALHHFSLALRSEWAEQGILVQTLVPGPTATGIETAGGAYDCPLRQGPRGDPATVAALSLARLERGDALVTTAKRLWLQRLFTALAPLDQQLRVIGRLARPRTPAQPGVHGPQGAENHPTEDEGALSAT